MATNDKDEIESELKIIREKYLKSAAEILRDYKEENEIASDYKGRQIYELLQNAEDQATDEEGDVLITYHSGILSISNTGLPFSLEGIKSLFRPNSSPKEKVQKTIGKKGLGFRSLLNWTDEIYVITQEYALKFSRDIAEEYLSNLCKENPTLKEFLLKENKNEKCMAVLPCPKFVDEEVTSGYITTIRIKCSDDNCADVTKQLESLDFNELLFLKKLQKVTIETDDFTRTFQKQISNITEDEKDAEIIIKSNNSKDIINKWHLYKKTGIISVKEDKLQLNDEKEYEFIIAYNREFDYSDNFLYSYFKTNIANDFPCLIHGTFELTADRNNLKPENEVNAQLLKILAGFMIDTAIKISEKVKENVKECNYDPLKLVLIEPKNDIFKKYDFYNTLNEEIKNKPIFPSIANSYIKLEDAKYSPKPFAKLLDSDTFSDLLQLCDNNFISDYLNKNISFYEYQDFSRKLNIGLDSDKYTIETRCKLINIIKNLGDKNFNGNGLHLLVNSKNENIKEGESFFIKPNDSSVIDLPDCLKTIQFMNETMQQLLLETSHIESRNLDTLATKYKDFGLKSYRINTLMKEMINLLEIQKDISDVSSALVWLFNYYKGHSDDTNLNLHENDMFVICRDGLVRHASECYLGSEFNNSVGEEIVSNISSNFIKQIEPFDNQDVQLVTSFYTELGVSKFPRIQTTELEKNQIVDYLDYSFSQIKSVYTTSYDNVRRNDLRGPNRIRSIKVSYVESFEFLIENLSLKQLIVWFTKDEKLTRELKSSTEISSNSQILCRPGAKVYDRTIQYRYMGNYIKYLLNKIEWMPIGANRVSIDKCCLEKLDLEPSIYSIDIPDSLYKELQTNYSISKEVVQVLFDDIGIVRDFDNFSLDKKYQLLLELPKITQNEKAIKKLYSYMKNIDRELLSNCKSYNDFKNDGEVLVKFRNSKLFVPISEAFYVDKKELNEDILSEFKIFDIEKRVGVKKVEDIFGVKQLKELKLEEDICELCDKNLQNEFNSDYQSYIPYVLTCRKLNSTSIEADINTLLKNSICLVTDISLKSPFFQESKLLSDYDSVYIKSKNIGYIKIPHNIKVLKELKNNKNFSNAISDIVTSFLDVNEDKGFYRELYECSNKDRDYLLINEKCDDNLVKLKEVRSQLNRKNDYKNIFWDNIGNLIEENYVALRKDEEIANFFKITVSEVNTLDYMNLSNFDNFKILRKVFKSNNLTTDEYNRKNPCYKINFKDGVTQDFIQRRTSYYECYKLYTYSKIKELNQYLDKVNNYFSLEPNITGNIEETFEDLFYDNYQVKIEDLNKYENQSFEDLAQTKIKEFNYKDDEINNKKKFYPKFSELCTRIT